MLPISSNGKPFNFVDSLFMSTSCVCVTGLSVLNVQAEVTVFGKVVMAILMELGGLSFLTIAVCFFSLLGGHLGYKYQYLLKESLNQNSLNGIVGLVKRIIFISFIIQLIGVVLNYIALMSYYDYDFLKTLGVSVFHSIASFNNAGFDIFGSDSMIGFKGDILLNVSTMFLIISGGLGFIVIYELFKKHNIKKLSIHSKIVLIMTGILIVLGTLLIKVSMYDEVTWLQAVFLSVSSRTAGFTSVDLSNIPTGAYITILSLMFIGASPCSTGGGIKTTTIFVIILTLIYYGFGKKPKIFCRRIADSSIFKAFVLFGVVVILVLAGTMIMGLGQSDLPIEKLLFEVISGFSTTGLSMGITSLLNAFNRIVMCFLMFFGRLGPLTIIGVLNNHMMNDSKENIQYVEERIIIG